MDHTTFPPLPLPEPIHDLETQHPVISSENLQESQLPDEAYWLCSHPFQPTKPFEIYVIDQHANIRDIMTLIQRVQQTRTFSIIIEHRYRVVKDTTIKIELIQVEQLKSIVLIFRVIDLFIENEELLSIMHVLLRSIFQPRNKFYTWNNNINDLCALVFTGYLAETIVKQIILIPLQYHFKEWYNRTFIHNENCNVPPSSQADNNDHSYCSCAHRPYKKNTAKWTITNALKYVFNENSTLVPSKNNHTALSCLAITKLNMILELNWSEEQLYQYKKFHQVLE
ncbi:unnamed protein product [Adineta steineri]|uniref:Uncharacterized protein n=1 Tax=Adineta steineri TaxID=433720 RepID=A0A815TZD8_9BILA|nr:unnamed protein product [Adineta steineri]CAF3932258.1 unnamed protein product [Adineta steineri]